MHKEELNGSHGPPDPNPAIFKDSATLRDRAFFPQFGLYLWREWSDFHYIFITEVSLDKEVPVKFWKYSGSTVLIQSPYPDTDSRYRPYSPWRTYAVSDCSCLYIAHSVKFADSINTKQTVLFLILIWTFCCHLDYSPHKMEHDRHKVHNSTQVMNFKC